MASARRWRHSNAAGPAALTLARLPPLSPSLPSSSPCLRSLHNRNRAGSGTVHGFYTNLLRTSAQVRSAKRTRAALPAALPAAAGPAPPQRGARRRQQPRTRPIGQQAPPSRPRGGAVGGGAVGGGGAGRGGDRKALVSGCGRRGGPGDSVRT